MSDKKVTAEEAYKVLGKVFNHPKMAGALHELDTSAKAREEAKKSAKEYLTRHGVELPTDVTAHFTEGSWKISICFFFFCIHFEHS